jgi:hypothetical protein
VELVFANVQLGFDGRGKVKIHVSKIYSYGDES